MVGRSRIERCSACGTRVLVLPLASTVRCHACYSTTRLHAPRDGRFHPDPDRPVGGWLRGLFSNAASGSGSFGSSSRNRRSTNGDNDGTGTGWPESFPSTRAKKRAVLIGVSYSSRLYELNGTVNDVNCMKYFLSQRFQFPDDSILVLTEEESDSNRKPTKENIRAAMRWLVWANEPGESLIFHFSGHGSQKLDLSGDEVDGFTETLCPLDYEENGVIVDDEINATLVRPLRSGAKLHAIIDSCHSGTVLDLPYLCRLSRGGFYQWEDHGSRSGEFKGTSGGLAICISGCEDSQSAQDTVALSGTVATGAMTYSFIHAVETDPGTTYGRLLGNMRCVIRGADAPPVGLKGPIAFFVRRVLSYGSKQEPQLSASEKFDIYRKPFLL